MAEGRGENAGTPTDAAPPSLDKFLDLRITRLGGHLPMMRPHKEFAVGSLSKEARAAIEALLSIKAGETTESRLPDATSYKIDLEGPGAHVSITVGGLHVPAILSKLLP
jgi:hypothetical protein